MKEDRKYERIPKCIPMRYAPPAPKSAEPCDLDAILLNMSSGGIYFRSKDQLELSPGQLIKFTMDISTDTTLPEKPVFCYFKGEGKVIRIDPPKGYHNTFGVAVEFLNPLGGSRKGV